MALAVIFLAVTTSIFLFLFIKKGEALKQVETDFDKFKNKYKDIIDLDNEIAKRTIDLAKLKSDLENLSADFSKRKEQLNMDFKSKRDIYENLLKEISILEENLEIISFGLYKPHFTYSTSEEFKQKLTQIVEKQKEVIRDDMATFCATKWTVEGSEAKGKKMVKEASKLMLRAFNGECDAAIAKVNWGNIANMEARIQKAFEAINKLGSTNQISITSQYMQLKLDELYLEFELEQKLQAEKEEQRAIKEQMREEEKALKELEKAAKDAQLEEERYAKALEKAKADVEKATGEELEKLNQKIKTLTDNLEKAHAQKERAISQAQLTKSGHVYIISNIGSFGENVYKIGMTRRLDPLDRVKELGDASVPFDFDVHGLIYSEDAPKLENTLHKHLDNKRLNLVDTRAEFFVTTIEEIEQILKDFNLSITLTKLAEAKEYRESLSLRQAKEKELSGTDSISKSNIEKQLEKIPISLD